MLTMYLNRVLLLVTFAAFVNAESYGRSGCISGASYLYSGDRSFTKDGVKCQRWDAVTPHTPMHIPDDGGRHNHCRNPDKDVKGTWCYTTDPEIRWDYCEIPKCPTKAVIMWNSVDEFKNVSSFSQVNGDPEYMSEKYDKSLDAESEDDTQTWESSRFKAFDTNYAAKLAYFTDERGNYFGIYNIETHAMEKFLHGMVEHIEAISYDWVTKNFYWTDSRLKSVMVADPTLHSYTPVYKLNGDDVPYALEVHSVKRLLIFSTYRTTSPEGTRSNIIATDLAGLNEKVLFSYPEVNKVVALTIDYAEDRIYWIEDIGHGSKVVSSRVDGTDKVQLYASDESNYYDLAVYSDYVYISDHRKRYNFFGDLRYHIQVITKRSNQVAHYKVLEKPMGMATYDENELYATTKPRGPRECIDTCDGICLPTLKGKRKCACSLGYVLQPKTNKCVPRLLDDDYLLVVDANEGHVHQISLTSAEASIAPLGGASRIISAAVDPSLKMAYFSDSRSRAVSKGILDNGANDHLTKYRARNIQIDSLTGNIFFTDGKTIRLSNSDGSVQQVILDSDSNVLSDIRAIALDLKNKYIYWTDTQSEENSGKLMRCRFDGTKKELVLDQLNMPHGVTVDLQSNRLYLVESKKAIVYEIPLSRLAKLKSISVNQPFYKKHILRRRQPQQFTEIKVHNGIAYIVDEHQPQVQRLDLKRENDLVGFGPAIFYRAASLSLYSKSSHDEFIKPLPNPCAKQSCSLCVEMSQTKTRCIRGETKKKASN